MAEERSTASSCSGLSSPGGDRSGNFFLKEESPGGEDSDATDSGSQIDPSYRRKVLKRSGTSIDYTEYDKNHAKLLVLYTGGTIGMKTHGGVYVPEANFLVSELRKLPMCHDPEYKTTALATHDHEMQEAPLVMPLSKEGKRVIYCVYEYQPLLDSSNMTFDDYARLATDIQENYHKFDGFVILHGTDTMAYTASALSFMFEDLGKPVVLTGSQIPIFEARSDGRDNFLGALIMAGHYCIPEVTVYFHNKLLRGNRTVKTDTGSLDAFHSPNLTPLAELGINIKVNWDQVFHPRAGGRFHAHADMCPHVGILRLFPSITKQSVSAFLQPPMQGIVIQSYGAGNGPDARKDLMEVLSDAASRGVLILNITQCMQGGVSAVYGTGKSLVDAGVVGGSDMTCEAALMKLSYVLSKEGDSEDKRKMLHTNLRGEMKVVLKQQPSLLDFTLMEKLTQSLRLSSIEEIEQVRDTVIPPMMCAAAKEGNISTLEKLRQCGVVFTIGDYDGRHPLHIAAAEGHFETVRYLLDNGATVHARDRYGHAALDDALRFHHQDIIQILVDAGGHLSVPLPKLGMLLAHTALSEGRRGLESWRLAGANLAQGDYGGRTVLHLACARGDVELVKYLLDQGVSVDVADSHGHTPLSEAQAGGHDNVVAMLQACETGINQ